MTKPDTNTLLLEAYRKASTVIHKLEMRGIELTEEEDDLWAEAESLVQEACP
jgi:hypothetical protein